MQSGQNEIITRIMLEHWQSEHEEETKREERKKGRRKKKGGEEKKKGGEEKKKGGEKNASLGIEPRTFCMEGSNSNC